MSRARIVRSTLLILALLGAGIQFVPVPRTNPPVTSALTAPPEVEAVLRRACYDCHSHETRWPWYSRVAPVSWFVVRHVNRGREELNFSEWPAYDFEQQDLDMGEMWSEIEEGDMPLPSYLRLHPDARLSDADKALIREWAGK